MLVLPENKWPLKWWAKRDQRPTFGGSSVRSVVWRLKDHLVDLFCFFWGRELVDVGGKSPCGPWVWRNNPHHIIPDECLDLKISDMLKIHRQSLTMFFSEKGWVEKNPGTFFFQKNWFSGEARVKLLVVVVFFDFCWEFFWGYDTMNHFPNLGGVLGTLKKKRGRWRTWLWNWQFVGGTSWRGQENLAGGF